MDYSDSFHHGDVAHINHVLRSDFSRRQGHQREQQFLRVCVGNANKCKFHSIRNRWINHASGNSWPTLALTSYIYMETVLLWPKALRHQHTHLPYCVSGHVLLPQPPPLGNGYGWVWIDDLSSDWAIIPAGHLAESNNIPEGSIEGMRGPGAADRVASWLFSDISDILKHNVTKELANYEIFINQAWLPCSCNILKQII